MGAVFVGFDHLTGFKILRVGLEGNWARGVFGPRECLWAGLVMAVWYFGLDFGNNKVHLVLS